MNSNKTTNKWRFLPEVVIFIVAVVLFLSQFYFFNLGENTVSSSLTRANVVNLQAIADLKKLETCGNWPITDIALSPGRGNPFNKKNQVDSPTSPPIKTCVPSN